MNEMINTTSLKNRSNISIWLFVISIWIFILEYGLYIITDSTLDKVIKVSAFIYMAYFLGYRLQGMLRSELLLIIIFYTLLLSALISVMFSANLPGISHWLKLLFMSSILPILIFSYSHLREKKERLLSVYIFISVLFSIQAIVAFLGVHRGVFDKTNKIVIARYNHMLEVDFGLWGYGNAIQTPFENVHVLRAQGWFLEPSLLASFLLLPLFLCAGQFLRDKKIRYLFLTGIIFIAFLLAQSLAGYLAFIIGAIIVVFSKFFHKKLRKVSFLKYSYIIVMFGVFLATALSILNVGHMANESFRNNYNTEKQTLASTLFRRDPKGPSGNLIRESHKLGKYISVIASNPLGIGFSLNSITSDLSTGNAFLFWALAGGIPAILLIFIFFIYIFIVFCHPLLISNDITLRCLGASFIGLAVHNLSYGNWMAPYFLLHLALVVMYAREQKNNSLRKGR